ncbi:hypothetical protein PH5382_00230 [Phaeobacter sp. CECT 5382]|nr:hypothetical protein PH5382_00230 [Phaeobacter sp. CECT 5382]
MSEGIDTNKSQLLNLKETPASFLAYGDAYLSAANILVLKKNDLNEVFKIGPIFQLSGQAFELIAKSLLLHKGVSESDFTKGFPNPSFANQRNLAMISGNFVKSYKTTMTLPQWWRVHS